MAYDVFISHSAKDKTIADAVCWTLEAEGIRCWIAPRDVMPGMEWGRSIVEAIEQTRIMLLVFTANANASPQIRREVERAVNRDVMILPFRVESVLPDKSLEYFIGNVHWLDALTPPLETHLKKLAVTIKVLLERMPVGVGPEEPQPLREVAPAMPAAPEPAVQPRPALGSVGGGPASVAAEDARPAEDGEVADSGSSEESSAARFGEWGSVFATDAAQERKKIPIWAWGAAVALAIVLVIFITVRSVLDTASTGAPPNVSLPSGGGAPAQESANPATQRPAPTGAGRVSADSPSQAPATAASDVSREGHSEAPAPQPRQNSGGSSGASPGTPQELAGEASALVAKQRYSEAKPLAEQACNGGSAFGCEILGLLYYGGLDVAHDNARAASLYQRACDGGDAKGCYALGRMYESGQASGERSAQAVSLYRRACDGGYTQACIDLGSAYEIGIGFSKDNAQAASLYRKACDGGSVVGCGYLGNLYVKGIGVTQDTARGTALLKKACDGGMGEACDQLKKLQE